MKLIPIKVECYSGYRSDELPKRFYWNNTWFEIEKITDRWYQGESSPEWPVSNYFKIATTDGVYLIKHDLESDEWNLCK